jgi:hypothetical protein
VKQSAKPKLGEVWEQLAPSDKPRTFYLVVGRHLYEQQTPPSDPPVFYEQHVLLNLESGRVRRVGVGSFNSANGWSRFRYRANKST